MNLQKKGSILIVEDMSNWREALFDILQNEYAVRLTKTIEEARKELENRVFDLIILDVRLEDDNPSNFQGIQLLREVKKKFKKTSVILLTAYSDSIRKEILNRYKPDGFFSKPLEIKKFKNRIRNLIEGKSAY
jgi:DNA-binding response OmpR family regulator